MIETRLYNCGGDYHLRADIFCCVGDGVVKDEENMDIGYAQYLDRKEKEDNKYITVED